MENMDFKTYASTYMGIDEDDAWLTAIDYIRNRDFDQLLIIRGRGGHGVTIKAFKEDEPKFEVKLLSSKTVSITNLEPEPEEKESVYDRLRIALTTVNPEIFAIDLRGCGKTDSQDAIVVNNLIKDFSYPSVSYLDDYNREDSKNKNRRKGKERVSNLSNIHNYTISKSSSHLNFKICNFKNRKKFFRRKVVSI